jgi:N6-adenosine-specific RNA methylase IME4
MRTPAESKGTEADGSLIETPDQVHGRLMESMHLSGYGFERAMSEFEWLLDADRWRRVGGGFDDINAFLATINLSRFKHTVDQRKGLAQRLEALQASQRATARTLGVNNATVSRDLAVANATHETGAPVQEDSPPVANATPEREWFADTTDPAELSQKRARRDKAARDADVARGVDATGVVNRDIRAASVAVMYSTIVLDPPWDWGDEGDQNQLGRAKPKYAALSLDELLALPVADWTTTNAHIYLWITNRSLPKGFALLERWGFRYIVNVAWVKPSFGMGNYFRGQHELVLFGVRGSLPLKRKDAGTVFAAPRGPDGHSSKPPAFLEFVESCSPGPYAQVFARSERAGWARLEVPS